jgi:Flp pilus assembly protein TadD
MYIELNRPQEAMAVLKPLADVEDAQPAVLYQAGRAALGSGHADEARVYFTRSVLKQPASPAARELGMIMAREGRVVEAYSMLRPWALGNPTDPDARLMAASLALTLERPDDAAELLKGQNEMEAAVRLLRGRVLIQKKDGPGAVATLQPLFANHPPGMDLEVRRNLAEAQLLAGKPGEAVNLLAGKTGDHPALVLLLGRAQRQAGNAPAALATLKPFADKLPDDPNTLGDPRPAGGIALEYGTLLSAAGRTPEAVAFLDKATRFTPRNAEAWKAYAKALDAAGRKDDARQAVARAEDAAKPAAPRSAYAPPQGGASPAAAGQEPALGKGLQSAVDFMSKGQLDSALAATRQEMAVSKDPRARMLEVRILLTQKKPDEAMKSVEAALKAEPNNPDYVYLKGAIEMGQQRWGSAETDLRKALQIAPRHTAAMNDLAVLLMTLNKKPEAQSLLEQVLKINPQDQMAAANLERLKAEAQQ